MKVISLVCNLTQRFVNGLLESNFNSLRVLQYINFAKVPQKKAPKALIKVELYIFRVKLGKLPFQGYENQELDLQSSPNSAIGLGDCEIQIKINKLSVETNIR